MLVIIWAKLPWQELASANNYLVIDLRRSIEIGEVEILPLFLDFVYIAKFNLNDK